MPVTTADGAGVTSDGTKQQQAAARMGSGGVEVMHLNSRWVHGGSHEYAPAPLRTAPTPASRRASQPILCRWRRLGSRLAPKNKEQRENKETKQQNRTAGAATHELELHTGCRQSPTSDG